MKTGADLRPHEFKILSDLIHRRHSERVDFDPEEPPSARDIEAILESARWAPTAHNMQNFEIVVVDRPETLSAIARIEVVRSETFLDENAAQLSWSEEELAERGTGLLATMFPPSWRTAGPRVREDTQGFLRDTMRHSPVVFLVLYDPSARAPASEGDFLGIMSLGCVLENMWLTATSLGIGLQLMSTCSDADVEVELRGILGIPERLRIAFACRLGYPAVLSPPSLRVRRPIRRFVHWNSYEPLEPSAS